MPKVREDLCVRLRNWQFPICLEAAEEIERLRAENELFQGVSKEFRELFLKRFKQHVEKCLTNRTGAVGCKLF